MPKQTLQSGHYDMRTVKKVTHWSTPDKNGDGEEVWVDQHDEGGNVLGRNVLTDEAGEPVRHYTPPEGFSNRPSFDHTDNYVKVDSQGRVQRTPSGHAINIKPGQTLVENPDGSVTYLNDDYSRFLFSKAHDAVDEPAKASLATGSVKQDRRENANVPADQTDAFDAWLKSREG